MYVETNRELTYRGKEVNGTI